MAGFHDVISKLDGNRQILTDGNVDIPFRSFIVDTLMYIRNITPCILQDFVPFVAAAQKNKKKKQTKKYKQKQETKPKTMIIKQ